MGRSPHRAATGGPASRALGIAAALAIALSSAACSADGEPLFSPAETASLAAIAPDLSMDELVEELSLPESKRAEFETRLGGLHDAMMSVHASLPQTTEGMPKQELEALHQTLQSKMQTVHQRHHELMLTLDAEQREKFMQHVHARMAEHHDAMGLQAPDHAAHGAGAPHESAAHAGGATGPHESAAHHGGATGAHESAAHAGAGLPDDHGVTHAEHSTTAAHQSVHSGGPSRPDLRDARGPAPRVDARHR